MLPQGGVGQRPSVCLVSGKGVIFPDRAEGVWYFRTAADQTELHWTISDGGFGVFDPDTHRLIHVPEPGQCDLPVKPNSVYLLLVNRMGGGLTSLKRDLVLAEKPGDLPPAPVAK